MVASSTNVLSGARKSFQQSTATVPMSSNRIRGDQGKLSKLEHKEDESVDDITEDDDEYPQVERLHVQDKPEDESYELKIEYLKLQEELK